MAEYNVTINTRRSLSRANTFSNIATGAAVYVGIRFAVSSFFAG